MNKVKDLFISHVEKLVLLIFVGGGGFHMFTTLKPAEQSNKKEELESLVKQMTNKHASSLPPPMPVPQYYNQMRAPFMRVPRIEPVGSWRWYKIPEVTNEFSIKEEDEKDFPLSFVKHVKKIEIKEGKEFAGIKVAGSTDPSLSVRALAPGKTTAVVYSSSGTTETVIIVVHPKVVKPLEGEGRLAYPPLKIEPEVERGAIKVFMLPDPANEDKEKALKLVGYKIYRKVGDDGEWTEIYFKQADIEDVEEEPSTVITEEATEIPALPGLEPAVEEPPQDEDNKKKGKKDKRDKRKSTKKEAMPVLREKPKASVRSGDWLAYTDTEVKPDTTYIYSATTVSRPMLGDEIDEEETVETKHDRCISKEIVSKSNLEIMLSGTFNNAASIYIKKYFNDIRFERKLFSVPVGDTIGTPRRMKVDGEYQQVDFSTGSILVDILEQVRDTTTEKRLIPLKDKNGRLVFKNGRMVRKEITVATVSEHTKIVVLDAKGRIREYMKK